MRDEILRGQVSSSSSADAPAGRSQQFIARRGEAFDRGMLGHDLDQADVKFPATTTRLSVSCELPTTTRGTTRGYFCLKRSSRRGMPVRAIVVLVRSTARAEVVSQPEEYAIPARRQVENPLGIREHDSPPAFQTDMTVATVEQPCVEMLLELLDLKVTAAGS